MSATFDRAQIEEALAELVETLAERGVAVRIEVIGGAAIALREGRDTTTRDIDAYFAQSGALVEVASEMAARRGWPERWLNDEAKGFASHHADQAAWEVWFTRGDVMVTVAPVDLLLAMKLNAARGRRDSTDIDFLCTACGVNSVAAAEEIFDRYFPADVMATRAQAQLVARFEADTP